MKSDKKHYYNAKALLLFLLLLLLVVFDVFYEFKCVYNITAMYNHRSKGTTFDFHKSK